MGMTKDDAAVSLHNNRHGTMVFTHGYSMAQCSDFPKYIFDYIIQNPKSPKQWKKLIQTCKIFFDKNPIVAIPCLHFHGHIFVGDKTVWYTCFPGLCNTHHNRRIEIFNVPFKLWITESLFLTEATNAKKLIPQIFRCDAKKLVLYKQIYFDEFLFLSSNVVDLCLGAKVTDKNDKTVQFEQIFESFPSSLATLEYYNHANDTSTKTFSKLSAMKRVPKLCKMKFYIRFFTAIDVDDLFKFMLKNKQIHFELHLSTRHSNEEDIQKIKNAVIKFKSDDHQLPRTYIDNKIFIIT